MRLIAKVLLVSVVAGVAYVAVPRTILIQIPGSRSFIRAKPLETVSLEQAIAQPRAGDLTVTFLYLSNLPPQVAVELSDDVKAWRKKGVAVRGYSIDPVPVRGEIANYVRDIGLDVPPVWIEMPNGAECAFNQMRAVNFFSGRQIDPSVTIPLLTLALTDRDGNTVGTYSLNVPNGGEIDLSMFDGALIPFNNSVTRAARAPKG